MRFGLAFFATLTFLFICDMASSIWLPCKPCKTEEECNRPPPEICPYGESTNFCNRRVCSKGPGERCGGPSRVHGQCGEGLQCKTDERCHGCYILTMECAH